MKKAAKKPSFVVIYNEFGHGIEFRNIFEFGQFSALMTHLKQLRKKLNQYYVIGGEKYQKLVEQIVWNEKERKKPYTPAELLEIELRHKCMYYFWSKCEYEVVVTGWPDTKTEKKIDIYQQLEANWEIFKNIVFEAL